LVGLQLVVGFDSLVSHVVVVGLVQLFVEVDLLLLVLSHCLRLCKLHKDNHVT